MDLSHTRRDVRLWHERRDESLDVALASVTRRVEQRLVVLIREMRCEQGDGRERHVAVGHAREDQRISPRGAGCRDAAVGRRLGETQHAGGPGEERGVALAEVEPACIDFGEERDELGRGAALNTGRAQGFREQRGIGQ